MGFDNYQSKSICRASFEYSFMFNMLNNIKSDFWWLYVNKFDIS